MKYTFEADSQYVDRFQFSIHHVGTPNSMTLGNLRQRLVRPNVIAWYREANTVRFDKCCNRFRCRGIVLRDYRFRKCIVEVSVVETDVAS